MPNINSKDDSHRHIQKEQVTKVCILDFSDLNLLLVLLLNNSVCFLPYIKTAHTKMTFDKLFVFHSKITKI